MNKKELAMSHWKKGKLTIYVSTQGQGVMMFDEEDMKLIKRVAADPKKKHIHTVERLPSGVLHGCTTCGDPVA